MSRADSPSSPAATEFREATVADAAAIAEIYNESIRSGDATMDDETKSEAQVREQIEGFGKREQFVLLERAGHVVGWGVIKHYSDRRGYRFCCETAVYLRRDELRRGYGSLIKKELIARCRKLGYHHLVAKIFADNLGSIEYNRRFGYEMVGIQREIGWKNGRWQDMAIMQLILADVAADIPEPLE